MTKRYDEYNDSGVEWIGEVPDHWSLSKIKTVSKIEKGKKVDSLDYEEYGYKKLLSMAYLRGKEEPEFVPYDKVKFAKDGECLILWDGANAGEIIKAKEGVLSSTVALFKMRRNINNNYFYYLLTVNEYSLRKLYTGMGIPHVSGDVLKNTQIFLPELKEQKAIATYLKNKTSKIDSAVAELEKQKSLLIELKKSTIHQAVTKGLDLTVPMKDSGVEWIGEVPRHWMIKRVKDKLINLGGGKYGNDEGKDNLDLPCISISDFKNGNISESSTIKMKRSYPKSNTMKKGTLLVEKSGGGEKNPVGRVIMIDKDIQSYYTNFVASLKTLENEKFYYYIMKNVHNRRVHMPFVKQNTGLQNFDYNGFALFQKMAFPKVLEQNEIVTYLDKKIGQIDQSIEVIDNQIAKMKEYKKTLINDVVTGKIKVI